jgi:hypothetical protein
MTKVIDERRSAERLHGHGDRRRRPEKAKGVIECSVSEPPPAAGSSTLHSMRPLRPISSPRAEVTLPSTPGSSRVRQGDITSIHVYCRLQNLAKFRRQVAAPDPLYCGQPCTAVISLEWNRDYRVARQVYCCTTATNETVLQGAFSQQTVHAAA